jgi:hypothetical protein
MASKLSLKLRQVGSDQTGAFGFHAAAATFELLIDGKPALPGCLFTALKLEVDVNTLIPVVTLQFTPTADCDIDIEADAAVIVEKEVPAALTADQVRYDRETEDKLYKAWAEGVERCVDDD